MPPNTARATDSDRDTQVINAAKEQFFGGAHDTRRKIAQALHRKNHFTPRIYDLEHAAIRRLAPKGSALGAALTGWFERMSLWGARRMTHHIPDEVAKDLYFNAGEDRQMSVECYRLRRNQLLTLPFVERSRDADGLGLGLITLEQRCDKHGTFGAWARHKAHRQKTKNDSAKRLRAARRAAADGPQNTIRVVSQRVKGATKPLRDPVSGRYTKTKTQIKDNNSKVVQDSPATAPPAAPDMSAEEVEAREIALALLESPFAADLPTSVRARYASGQLIDQPEAANAAGCETGHKMPVEDKEGAQGPRALTRAERAAAANLAASEAASMALAKDERLADDAYIRCLDIARKPLYAGNKSYYARTGERLEAAIETMRSLGLERGIHRAAHERLAAVNRLFDACHEPVARLGDLKKLQQDFPHARGLFIRPALGLNVSHTFWRYEAERMVEDGSSRLHNSVGILYSRVKARAEALHGP